MADVFDMGNALMRGAQMGSQIAAARQQQNALAQGMVPSGGYSNYVQPVPVEVMGQTVMMDPFEAEKRQAAQAQAAVEAEQAAYERAQRPMVEAQAGADLDKTRAEVDGIRTEARVNAAEAAGKMDDNARRQSLSDLMATYQGARSAWSGGEEAWNRFLFSRADEIRDELQVDWQQLRYEDGRVILGMLEGAIEGVRIASELPASEFLKPDQSGYADMSAADQEIARLESVGVPRDVAIKLGAGAFKSITDQGTGETVIVDITSNRQVGRIDSQTGQYVSAAPQAAPAATSTPQPEAQSPQQPALSLSFGPDVPQTGANAFGLRGAANNILNTIGDATGMGMPAPEVEEHRVFFRDLEERILNSYAQGYGRQPVAAAMERLRTLAPNVGNLSEGPERARIELNAARNRVSRELQNAETSLSSRRMKVEDRAELRSQISGLTNMLSTIDEGLTRLGSAPAQGSNSGTTASGVTWSVE